MLRYFHSGMASRTGMSIYAQAQQKNSWAIKELDGTCTVFPNSILAPSVERTPLVILRFF